MPDDEDPKKKALQDLHRGLERWIPMRKSTITAMEEIADKILQASKDASITKAVGSSVGIVAGVTAGVIGAIAIFGTGGLATPLVVAGAVAGVAGVGGAITAGGADIAKAIKLPQLMGDAQDEIDKEIDAYYSVILKLKALNEVVTDKSKLDIPSGASDLAHGAAIVGKALPVLVVNLLQIYCNMCFHITQIAAIAAAEAAATVAAQTARSVGFIATEKLAVKAATEAAEKAASSTAVGALLKGVSKSTCESVAKASGKAAGEAAIRAARNASQATIKAAAESAARPAAKLAAKEALKASTKAVGEAVGGLAGKAAPVIAKGAIKALPFLNFGFAAWDSIEAYSASKELYAGPEEERLLKAKIEKLKEEANDIVVTIYNDLAKPYKLPLLDTPYPECKTEKE